MLIESHNNLSLLYFELLHSCPGLIHAVSTRKDPAAPDTLLDLAWAPGDARETVRGRLSAVAEALNIDQDRVCCAHQVHGSRVQCIDAVPPMALKGKARHSAWML